MAGNIESFLYYSLSFVIVYLVSAFLHLFYILLSRDPKNRCLRPANKKQSTQTLIVMGSGGHTAEMIRLLKDLDFRKFSPRLYVVAQTDHTSSSRIKELENNKNSIHNSQITTISRSREVKQSWFTTVLSFIVSTVESFKTIGLSRPDLILCNGPGTCVPLCLVAFLFKVFWIKDITIVFVESICRVNSLSLTGKIMVAFLADRSLVQWPELNQKYPQTVYIGRLV